MANHHSNRLTAQTGTRPVPIIVHGAAGRMGARILTLASEDPNLHIVAGVDKVVGRLRDLGIPSDAPLLVEMPVEKGAVVIDFSNHTTWKGLTAHCAAHGMSLVSGTTGISPMELEEGISAVAKSASVLYAPNMSVGVNVVFRVAAQIARTLGLDYDIEVVEAHHNQKVDAPSGTAFGITDAICAATHRSRTDLKHGRQGQTGARPKGEIGVHALRMGDVVGDHTVYFVGNGERIQLSHVAHSRDIFVKGALRAAAFIGKAKPGRYTMDHVLGL
jgi:4-hydroxy-tetrahydrodipicolinate reductase